VQIGVAGLLGIGITVGVLLGRQSGGPVSSAGAVPEHAPAVEAAVPAAAKPAEPAPTPAPPPPAMPPAPPAPDPEVVATDVPAPSEPVTPHATTTAPATTAPATTAPATTPRREAVRVIPKPRPARRPIPMDAEVAKPATPPPATTFRSGDTPFANGSFDDANNTGVAPAAPNRTKVKKTPIVTNFGN
jgi:hypothetical protein